MMKKWLGFFTAAAILTGVFSPCTALAEAVTRIYVSQAGNDNNSGTIDAPFKTIEKAQSAARDIIANGMEENLEVIIGPGTYTLDKTWVFDERDSGNNGFSVRYIGENYPLISGGKKIEGFENLGNGMWKAYAPEFEFIRELYVNDVRRYRASGEKEIVGVGNYDDPKTAKTVDGFYFDKNVLPIYERADDITMRSGVGWKGHEWGVKKIFADPENEDRTIAVMDNYAYSQLTIPNWAHAARYDIGLRVENAFELLDNPGEFYFNKDTKELFYIPKDGEDMNTAEVYAPVLETLLSAEGNCAEGKYIENLSFDGLRFAHTTLYFPEIMGYAPGQASTLHLSDRIQLNGNEGDVYSALRFSTVRNCKMENCVIFGAGGIGVRIYHTIDGFVFNGNAIYDINESGITVGGSGIDKMPEEVTEIPENYRYDMMNAKSRITASDVGGFGVTHISPAKEGAYWFPANDVSAGIKSWYRLDFDEPVTIDEVVLVTADQKGDHPQKRNFEIIVSNDKDFENYKVLYSCGNSGYYPSELSVKPGDSSKYKYFMIRKTEVESFRITKIHVYTKDIAYQPVYTPQKVTLSNNYITRVGNYYYSGVGIHSYYSSDLTIKNNEIYKTPYTGLSTGWGWAGGAENIWRTKVLNNKIDTFNVEIQDGGGMYFLNRQYDSEIKGNYIRNQQGPFGAIYFDQGSEDWYACDNVVENCTNSIFNWYAKSNKSITVENTYADASYFNNSGKNSTVEPIHVFPSGNPSVEAQSIIDNAGIKEEYSYIKNFVPDNNTYYGNVPIDEYNSIYGHYGTTYSTYTNGKLEISKILLSNTDCGTLPGQYSAYDKLVLQERVDELSKEERTSDSTARGTGERTIRLETANKKYSESLVRLSYEETLQAAKSLAENTETGLGIGKATAAAKEKLKSAISSAEQGNAGEYAKIKALEEAICEFDKEIPRADITSMKLIGYDCRPVIDKDSHTVEFGLSKGTDLSNVKANVLLAEGCEIYPDFSKGIDLQYPVQAIVSNGEYVQEWTIQASEETAERWWNWYDEAYSEDGGNVIFDETEKVNMNLSERCNYLEITLKKPVLDNNYKTRVVFDSTKAQLVEDSNSPETGYFALDIYKDNICLTQVQGGVETVIYGRSESSKRVIKDILKTSDYIEEGENAALKISTQKVGDYVVCVVKINDKAAINTMCRAHNSEETGFWGVCSQKAPLELTY